MTETLGDRLKRLRKAAQLTQAALAGRVGLTQSAIGNIEANTRGYGASVVEIAKVLSTTPEYLQLDSDLQQALSQHNAANAEIALDNNPDYPAIKRVKFKLSAGAHGFAVEYQDDEGTPMVFSRGWFAKKGLNPDKLFAVPVSNGSMEPLLYHGDVVVVNTESTTARDGLVFAVNYEGELVIKRLIRDAGEWWLSSDNVDQRRYPRKLCGEGVHLVGEIVHRQSERI